MSVLSEAALLERHHRQIYLRPRWLSQRLTGLAALLVWRHGQDHHGPAGLAALGRSTLFVLSVLPGRTRFGRPAHVLLLRGYRPSWDAAAGHMVLGGPWQNVCGFDLRYRPFAGATGKILSTERTSLLQVGLQLDAALQAAALDRDRSLVVRPPLPDYWLGFEAGHLPPVPDNAATRQAALQALGEDYQGPVLPCLRGPGGIVTDLDQANDGIHVLFNDDHVIRLPSQAVLRPEVKAGQFLPAGALLGDFLPRRQYPHWMAVVRILGPQDAGWLLQNAVEAWDTAHAGLICRRVEFVARPVEGVRGVFEDLRALLGKTWQSAASPVFVWVSRGRKELSFDRPGLHVDLQSLHPHWDAKFRLPSVQAVAGSSISIPLH